MPVVVSAVVSAAVVSTSAVIPAVINRWCNVAHRGRVIHLLRRIICLLLRVVSPLWWVVGLLLRIVGDLLFRVVRLACSDGGSRRCAKYATNHCAIATANGATDDGSGTSAQKSADHGVIGQGDGGGQ